MNRVLSLEQLRGGRCVPMKNRLPMSSAHIDEQIHVLPIWARHDNALVRDYEFRDYPQTIAFVNAVAGVANQEDHHPELLVNYGKVRVSYTTHAIGGISINDFICAAKIDALYES
ncbi:4a-hydroxytetrahydrobiopterin dehydratase [Pigmentiphaga sp. NML080357]|uniref:4a-hydroxytetrahydrobiopterin dehydratase n=1 Tax=Pigmentiphaga sp. NML080357 TaxID=2008675 RepID=UPI0018E9BC02|nr:4a-hydroxytetrahydrobiopterin dehydratase [Pigmentiphaga sp. NML080357]